VGDPNSFTHVNFVGMYVGIGSIQYQRVVSCVSAEDTLGVGERCLPCFALVEHFGGKQNHQLSTWDFSWGSPHPPMGQSLGGRRVRRAVKLEYHLNKSKAGDGKGQRLW
jgi:hypothetical protein